MIAHRSLLRINLLAWKSANTFVKSEPWPYFQKFNSCHALSIEPKMDIGKGKKSNFDRKKRIEVRQTWRAVSTQPNCRQDDSEKEEVQNPLENIQDAVSITVSIAKSDHASIDGLVGSDTCITADDKSLDDSSRPPKKHSMPMEVGASLMRFIKGKGGATQVDIEAETSVKIIFPSSRKEDSIIIEGESPESIANASKKIQMIVDKAVNSREFDYSHFVSLPLAIHPGLVDKLVDFQNKILGVMNSDKEAMESDAGADTSDEEDERKVSKVSVELKAENTDPHVKVNITSDQHWTEAPLVAVAVKAEDSETPVKVNINNIPLVSYPPKESKSAPKANSSELADLGIEKSIFIKPKTFHLTVLMLKLWNKDRVKAAAEVLQSVSSKVMEALENRPVQITLKGLDCMRGSPAKARVLYAPVEEVGGEGRLLRACQVITDAFAEAGLVIDKDVEQKLKLHATLINARHRKRKNRSRKVDSFDARGIFDLYGSEEWGEYLIREAHLSQRFLFDENGYYYCCSSIPFPENMQVD